MTKPARKPLRRTAWGMFLSGLAVAAVMLGVGIHVVSKGDSSGPGQAATWPAGTEIGVFRPLGRQQDQGSYRVACRVTPDDGEPLRTLLTWGEPTQPDFAVEATITCEQPVRVLTDPELTIAGITRGPLIAVPLFTMFLGLLFFFPRFAAFAASLSHPYGRIVDRITGRDRNL